MKTLKKNIIVYDDECPLCDLYTGGFVKSGMLDQDGRVPFSEIDQTLKCMIDHQRACNEIALVDIENRNILYGAESIAAVVGNNYPIVTRLFRVSILRWIAVKSYAFISYNRKVIVPGARNSICSPSFNLKYRLAYIVVASLIAAAILHQYLLNLIPLVPRGTFFRELAIIGGQIIFQCLLLLLLCERRIFEYVGQMMTVSLLGSLLLLPGFMLKLLQADKPLIFAAYFVIVVTIMFAEHIRRIKLTNIHWIASVGWVAYRLILLALLL